MLLQTISVTSSPLSPKSPNECGLNVFSLFLYAGMHGLCSAGQLYIPLFLYILSVTATVALSLFVHPSQNHSRRQASIQRVTYSDKSSPVRAAPATSTGNYRHKYFDRTFTVRSPRGGINKRSVDYFLSLPKQPLILTTLRGFTLKVDTDGEIRGTFAAVPTNNIPKNIPEMLFYILTVRKTPSERSLDDSEPERQPYNNDTEFIIYSLNSKRYICMDIHAVVYTQDMVNKTLPFDCIWRIKTHSIGTSISQSYYPQPVQYIKNTTNIKRWFLAIDRYGNIRNGNKTKGRRVSSVWRIHPSVSDLNLSNDRHVMNAMERDGIEVTDPHDSSPHQRITSGFLDPKLLRDDNRLREARECFKVMSILQKEVKKDIKRSKIILKDANFTRERIIDLLKSYDDNFKATQVRRFRQDYDKWIKMHWLSFKWKNRARCIRNKVKKLKRKINNVRYRHVLHQIKRLQKSHRIVEEDLSDWRIAKSRIIDFIKPLTFLGFPTKKGRMRIHDIIRKKLHLHLHSFKQIRWAVYADIYFNSDDPVVFKYGESERYMSRRNASDGSCSKFPELPLPRQPFPLHKWHRHLPCVKKLDQTLKQLKRSDYFRG